MRISRNSRDSASPRAGGSSLERRLDAKVSHGLPILEINFTSKCDPARWQIIRSFLSRSRFVNIFFLFRLFQCEHRNGNWADFYSVRLKIIIIS